MKFITGGAYQGKRNFAINHLNIDKKDIYDCDIYDINKIINSKCIYNYHILIKNLILKDIDTIESTENILLNNKDIVIIMNEIGCGIVPVDKKERFWREMCGKCGCIIAGKAETVVRVVCGTGVVIKGKL